MAFTYSDEVYFKASKRARQGCTDPEKNITVVASGWGLPGSNSTPYYVEFKGNFFELNIHEYVERGKRIYSTGSLHSGNIEFFKLHLEEISQYIRETILAIKEQKHLRYLDITEHSDVEEFDPTKYTVCFGLYEPKPEPEVPSTLKMVTLSTLKFGGLLLASIPLCCSGYIISLIFHELDKANEHMFNSFYILQILFLIIGDILFLWSTILFSSGVFGEDKRTMIYGLAASATACVAITASFLSSQFI